jgi:prevent-host-death family protein
MASSVTLHEAQEKLAELIDRAVSGEEIVIEREGRAAAKIVPVAVAEPRKEPRIGGQNVLGVTYIAPDFDDPMTEEELAEWGM